MICLTENQKQIVYFYLRKFDPKTVYSIMNEIEKENNYRFKNKRKFFLEYLKNYLRIYKCTISDSKKENLIYRFLFLCLTIKLNKKNTIIKLVN